MSTLRADGVGLLVVRVRVLSGAELGVEALVMLDLVEMDLTLFVLVVLLLLDLLREEGMNGIDRPTTRNFRSMWTYLALVVAGW